MNLRIKRMLFFLVLVICCINFLEAQSLPGFPDDVDDEMPTAPIDGFIGFAAIVGIYLGVKSNLRKKD